MRHTVIVTWMISRIWTGMTQHSISPLTLWMGLVEGVREGVGWGEGVGCRPDL